MNPKEFWKSTLRHLFLLRSHQRKIYQDEWHRTRNLEFAIKVGQMHPKSGEKLWQDLRSPSDMYKLDIDHDREVSLRKHIMDNKVSPEEFIKIAEERAKIIKQNK